MKTLRLTDSQYDVLLSIIDRAADDAYHQAQYGDSTDQEIGEAAGAEIAAFADAIRTGGAMIDAG